MPGRECVFCQIAAGALPAHTVLDEPDVLGFLDRRPLFPGHVLVVPRMHYPTLATVPADLLVTVMVAVQRLSAAIPQALGAQGTFVAANNTVSQSVPHLHWHVVPRTKGDGLRGFFWPRTSYTSPAHADDVAATIRSALA